MPANLLFPNWHALSQLDSAFWSAPIDLTEDDIFFGILGNVVDDQTRAARCGNTDLFRLSEAMASDIVEIQSRDQPICDLINLHYLQFEVSIFPFMVAMNDGDFNTAHDWILNGFGDSISKEVARQFYVRRVYDILETQIPWIARKRQASLAEWLISFYYYCRARAAIFDTAQALIGAAIRIVDSLPASDPHQIGIMRSILDWSSSYNHEIAPYVANWLEERFEDPRVSLRQRAEIAISLSPNAGRFSARPMRAWAEWALRNARDELVQHEAFQLLMTTVDTKADWLRTKDEIQAEIERSIQQLLLSDRPPTSAAILRDQRCNLLNPLTFKLHGFGLRDDLLRIFCAWYQIPPDKSAQSNVFFLLPNHSDGMACLGTESILLQDPDRSKSLGEIIEETNNSLGMTLTLQGIKLADEIRDRLGMPDYDRAQDFERALRNFYKFDQMTVSPITNSQAMVSFPAYPHPLQALMKSLIGQTLPISASLERTEMDRAIRCAGVWYAGNDFYSQLEAEALSRIFVEAGVQVTLESGAEKSRGDFLEFYQNTDFDLLWIAGHGIYNHWNPESAAILAGNETEISIDEMLAHEIGGRGRRLLVLNICDGGVASVLGGIHKLGLAPMLASQKQAVASHLWPIEPRVAAAFGLMFACSLVSGNRSFFQSFEVVLDGLRRPWYEIVGEISEVIQGDIVDRLGNTDIDTTNLFHWGSPCFFQ